ncbi:MAG: TIGR04086 family membrane protein [Clostridia bacterium]|nr:TIGR04086 family membrane protein [Clostridia bacterium]
MTRTQKNPYLGIPIGVIASMLLSVLLVALCALLLQKQVLGFESVYIVNPIIKSVCALAAALIGTARFEKRRWLWGAVCGMGYIAITTLLFGVLSVELSLSPANLIDLCMCAFAGMIGGIIRSLSK